MTSTLPPGPYQTLKTVEGGPFPYYIIPFDRDGVCEGPKTQKLLLANLAGVTDVFLFSHGWNNDWTAATERYQHFIEGFQKLRADNKLPIPKDFKPLLVGVFWPSQTMAWFAAEHGPSFAAGGPAATGQDHADLRDMAAALPTAERARFHELVQSTRLEKGEDVELAEILSRALAKASDDEVGGTAPPSARDLLAAGSVLETPEPDYDAVGVASATVAKDPAAAGILDAALRVLDPRNLIKPFTVWQMKDRAGRVGAYGVAKLLHELLVGSTARIHLLGHSFGCKVVMTAACVPAELPRLIESALLLQPAVSKYAFATEVPNKTVPGGFARAIGRFVRPIMTTYSVHDQALYRTFHMAMRRSADLGELQFAGDADENVFGALGGFGPKGAPATLVPIKKVGSKYDLADPTKIIGVDGEATITSHGDISQLATWWAEYCLVTAHMDDV